MYQITATDGDRGPDGEIHFNITSSDGDGVFAVNSSSGVLTLNCASCLDFNQKEIYTVVVRATDGNFVIMFLFFSVYM